MRPLCNTSETYKALLPKRLNDYIMYESAEPLNEEEVYYIWEDFDYSIAKTIKYLQKDQSYDTAELYGYDHPQAIA